MNLLEEAILDCLWARYVRAFGAPPPIRSASLDDAIAFLRTALETRAAGGASCETPATPTPIAA